jgi:DNA-binding transcriptional LysR family regulator
MHQVEYFLAICSQGTFTRAAKRCGVSQPSLTNAIKRLERELGGMLFHRGPTTTCLSDLGYAVRPHFERLLQCAEAARSEAAASGSLKPSPDHLNTNTYGGRNEQVCESDRGDCFDDIGRDDADQGAIVP